MTSNNTTAELERQRTQAWEALTICETLWADTRDHPFSPGNPVVDLVSVWISRWFVRRAERACGRELVAR